MQLAATLGGNSLFLHGVRALAGRRLAGGEWRWGRAALLDVFVSLRFLLFLVASHLTFGHGDLPLLVMIVARPKDSKSANTCKPASAVEIDYSARETPLGTDASRVQAIGHTPLSATMSGG
jgi:hypothetical protein